MKHFIFLFIFCCSLISSAQITSAQYEKYPVFKECENTDVDAMESCFKRALQQFIYENFQVPNKVFAENYKGNVNVLFEVTKEGEFKVLYVDGIYEELKTEARRVFGALPKIQPATYNGKPAYVQFTLPIAIPLVVPGENIVQNTELEEKNEREQLVEEYEAIENLPYNNEEYRSNINIPLSHHNYSLLDPALNRVGLNNHTAQKPYIYSEVNKYYDFEAANREILKNKSSWFGRKLWNEHLITIKGKDYWLTLDAGVDLQAGKDFDADIDTYNNTRLVYTSGGIGK